MKLLHIQAVGNHINAIESSLACSSKDSYLTIYSELTKRLLLYPNFLNTALSKLGYECQPFLIDSPTFLNALASHLEVSFTTPLDIFLRFIETFQPNILYFQRSALSFLTHEKIDALRKKYPYIQLIVGFWGAQLEENAIPKQFGSLDHIFCINDYIQAQIQKVCKSTSLLPPFIEHKESDFDTNGERKYDIIFSGSSGYGYFDHKKRYKMLLEISKALPIDLFLYEEPLERKTLLLLKDKLSRFFSGFPSHFLKGLEIVSPKKLRVIFDTAQKMRKGQYEPNPFLTLPLLSTVCKGTVYPPRFGKEYLALYAETMVALNIHVDDVNNACNQRCFEATSVGACLLTDRAHKMNHLFQDGIEIIGYENLADAIEKGKWLLDNPSKAREIGRAGMKRTLRDHTIHNRSKEIHSVLQMLL